MQCQASGANWGHSAAHVTLNQIHAVKEVVATWSTARVLDVFASAMQAQAIGWRRGELEKKLVQAMRQGVQTVVSAAAAPPPPPPPIIPDIAPVPRPDPPAAAGSATAQAPLLPNLAPPPPPPPPPDPAPLPHPPAAVASGPAQAVPAPPSNPGAPVVAAALPCFLDGQGAVEAAPPPSQMRQHAPIKTSYPLMSTWVERGGTCFRGGVVCGAR